MTLPTFIFIFFTGQCNNETQFTCSSGERQCIPIGFARDGSEDCSDGSDEYSASTTFLLEGRSDGTVDLLPGNYGDSNIKYLFTFFVSFHGGYK